MNDTTYYEESIEDLEERVAAYEDVISRWNRLHNNAKSQLRDLRSIDYIEKHNITLDDVETMEHPTIWHSTSYGFAEYLESLRSTKKFAEWNGRLYPMAEFIAGRTNSTPALLKHVPTNKEPNECDRS